MINCLKGGFKMKETDLTSLESCLQQTIDDYSNIPIAGEYNKVQACQILTRELKLISDEKKRISDEKLQNERFQLEKDHRYWDEKFQETKHKDESDIAKERLDLDKKRFDLDEKRQDSIEENDKLRLEIEKSRLDLEKATFEFTVQNSKEERKFKWISLGLSIGVPALTTLITLLVYRNLAYSNLKLIYVDEGRPTQDFKDACKSVKNLIK